MSEIVANLTESSRVQAPSRSFAHVISRNVAASVFRVVVVAAVALLLPAYLTRFLPAELYAAWVLILQLGAYVSYLDFGIQTSVSKFVAEYEAREDRFGAGIHASSGLTLMLFAGALGLILTSALTWQVPRLFRAMPPGLFPQVRLSVILVGSSLAFSLVCSVYSGIFLGLQRYSIPVAISVINRLAFSAVVIAVVALHGNLIAMSIGVALVNVATGGAQILAWKLKAFHIRISIAVSDRSTVRSVARYCLFQSVWTLGVVCVSGLDIAIVGHYDYLQTAAYAIAALPIGFLSAIAASMLNPFLPASSAMSTTHSPSELGRFLITITRYSTAILLLTGLPMIVFALPVLRLWVGPAYAVQALPYLRILILATVIRNLCAPYATMICATGAQRAAIITAVAEAVVNVGFSIYLARHLGAIGVALGTLIGSVVSVSLHFATTMRFARRTIAVSRSGLFFQGLVKPLVVAIPSLFLLLLWWFSATSDGRSTVGRSMVGRSMVLWAIATLAFAWFLAIKKDERVKLARLARNVFLKYGFA